VALALPLIAPISASADDFWNRYKKAIEFKQAYTDNMPETVKRLCKAMKPFCSACCGPRLGGLLPSNSRLVPTDNLGNAAPASKPIVRIR
jgi:hypothetical protein